MKRDFDVNRFVTEARLDVRPTEGMELTTTYGLTHIGSAVDLTAANGAAQVKNWQYQSMQERLRWGNLFAQVFMNVSDAGNKDSLDQTGTFLLRSGQPIVDQSRVAAGSVQHSFDVGTRQRFIYGGDYTWTNPRTGGTIDGRNEDDDNVTEYGGYVHSLTRLNPQWELTAALRADRNSRLDGTFFSPRAALVFKPTESQNFRFTYNRAYSTPANFSFFLDLIQAHNVSGLPYDVRAMGVPPEGGWDYRRSCSASLAGGLCMRSPFVSTLGAANTYVDANAASYYQTALAIVKPQLPSSVAALVPILNALNPTSAQVGSVLRYLVGNGAAVDPASVTHIDPLKASFVNNYEVGYKGLAGNSTRLSAAGWYQQRINFIGAPQISTPNVFLEPNSLGAYLGAQITGALIAQGMPAAQAQATAAAAAPAIAAGLAKVPVGTVTFDNAKLANRPDVMFTYRNVDKTITLWGLDLGFDQTLTDRFSVEGTYSFVNKDSFSEVSDPGAGPLRHQLAEEQGIAHRSLQRRSTRIQGGAADAIHRGIRRELGRVRERRDVLVAWSDVQHGDECRMLSVSRGSHGIPPRRGLHEVASTDREGGELVRQCDQLARSPGPDLRRRSVARPPRHDAAAVQLLREQVSGLRSQGTIRVRIRAAGFRCCHRSPAAFVCGARTR